MHAPPRALASTAVVAMRVRKPRAVTPAGTPALLPQRLRKMASSLSATRGSGRVLAVGLFSVAMLLMLGFADIPFLGESDDQFIERQRLLRRTRELRAARDTRRRRARAPPAHGMSALALDHAREPPAPPPPPPPREKRSEHREDRENRDDQRHRDPPEHHDPPAEHHEEHKEPHHEQPKRSKPHKSKSHPSTWRRPKPRNDKRTAGMGGRLMPPTLAAEVLWDEGSPPVKVCRIHQVCMRPDRTLVLPKWLDGHQDLLEDCGVIDAEFWSKEAEYNKSSPTIGVDLFGNKPARYHIPHFLTDVLPMLYATELMRPTFSDPDTRHYACTAAEDRPCPADLARDKLNAALFVEDRVAKQPADAWVPQLISMLPLQPELAVPAALFEEDQPACFRSIVTYPPRYVHTGRGWYGPQNELFSTNGISRDSVRRKPEKGSICEVQVVILNRFGWVRRGGYLTGRDITNIEEIQGRLQEAQQNERFRDSLRVDVAVEYFEDTGFREQVSIMQKADVVVGVHGAGLGNLLFAHLDAPFIEVLPFGYYAGPFDRLADALHLPYRTIISEPDTDNFMECLNGRAQQSNRPDVAIKGATMWKEALKTWAETGERVLNSQLFNSDDTTPIKLCARSQRMRLDPDVATRIILEAAENVCNITSSD